MRTIGVITTSRADYGIYLPVLNAIEQQADLKLEIYVSGTHLSPEYGMTINHIVEDGFNIVAKVESVISSSSPQGIGKSIGLTVTGFTQVFAEKSPDILLVLGDRYEMFAAVIASVPFNIPVAHIHGGESTIGAFDEGFRHSITKLSHIHFTATKEYAERVKQLGEEPRRVFISGAPSLDNIKTLKKMMPSEIEERFNIKIYADSLLVTYHPVTLDFESAKVQINNLLRVLDKINKPVIFTMPNSDTMGLYISEVIKKYVEEHENSFFVKSLGMQAYLSLLHYVKAMVGNSSSGIIEAASFKLPVVNIGDRQLGRVKGENVIDCGYKVTQVNQAIKLAISNDFRNSLKKIKNPYGNGQGAKVIVNKLKAIKLDNKLLMKQFIDYKI